MEQKEVAIFFEIYFKQTGLCSHRRNDPNNSKHQNYATGLDNSAAMYIHNRTFTSICNDKEAYV
jgi:hypothetical protein